MTDAKFVLLNSGGYGVTGKDILPGQRVKIDGDEIVVGNIVTADNETGMVIAAISPATKNASWFIAGKGEKLERATYVRQGARFRITGKNLTPGQRVQVDKRNGSEDIKIVDQVLTRDACGNCVASFRG